jgi:GNAT superfamily N-acetyltransferase
MSPVSGLPGQPAPDSPARTRELPLRRGLWYRVHPAGSLDLDQGKARSRPRPGIGQSGLSAFASPHDLYDYIREMDWGGRGWLHGHDDGVTPRRVIAFHGREIGRGAKDEPLVRPDTDMGCCGLVLHGDMAWSTFTRRLSDTPRPQARWDPGQAREMARLRASGQRGLHRRQRAASFTYHHTPYQGGVHWFSADNRHGYEIGHATVVEPDGPAGTHVEIERLEVDRHYRRKGVGSQLIENVAWRFPGRELRLKPYAEDPDRGPTTEELYAYYACRGFDPYQLKEGDPWSLGDYMTRPAADSTTGPGGDRLAVVVFEHDGDFPAAALTSPQEPPAALPARQQAAFDAPHYETHRRRMLEVAVNPDPGTRVWRAEQRPWDEDPATVTSAATQWGVNPDTITRPAGEPGKRTVIWQAAIDDPPAQLVPRSHPAWGRHPSLDSMAAVRFRPGSQVRLEGAWVAEGPQRDRGYFLPATPGRMGDGWRWHPAARHVTVEHDPAPGDTVDYVGVPGLPAARSRRGSQRAAGQGPPASSTVAAGGTVSESAFPVPPQPRPPGGRPAPAARTAGRAGARSGTRRAAP